MQSLWNSAESERWNSNELEQRIYSARLLAKEADLGCTFGGTVSVKTTEKDLFGEPAELIHVHAAATNLARIEFAQFIPLRRDHLLRFAQSAGTLGPRAGTTDPISIEPIKFGRADTGRIASCGNSSEIRRSGQRGCDFKPDQYHAPPS